MRRRTRDRFDTATSGSREATAPIRIGSERGAVMVEFALVLPLLALLLFGVLEFGRALNYWIDETHLAASGARLAAVNTGNAGAAALPACPDGSAPANLAAAVQCTADTKELRFGGTSSMAAPARVCITFPAGTDRGTGYAKVDVTSSFSWVPLLGVDVASSTIHGSATMRLEADWAGPSEVCYP